MPAPCPEVPNRRGRRRGYDCAMPAPFITFEGIDGCGKTTQADLLYRKLQAQGVPVLLTREPGGTALGEQIRSLILRAPAAYSEPAGYSAPATPSVAVSTSSAASTSSDAALALPGESVVEPELDVRSEALLYAADRAHHIATKVRPALAAGVVVLQDRYVDSSVAYQGAGRELGAEEIRSLSAWATRGLQPDLTLLFDLDPQVARQRMTQRRTGELDRLEAAGVEFQQTVRDEYLQLAQAEPGRFAVIDATGSIEQIQRQVIAAVSQALRAAGFAGFAGCAAQEGGA